MIVESTKEKAGETMGNVIVIGSYVTDLMTRTPHLPVPGETVLGGPFQMGPGGKGGNQAIAASRCGAGVTYVTKVGADMLGDQAMQFFRKEGMDVSFIQQVSDEMTGTAQILVDEQSENSIVVALGACGTITSEDVLAAEGKFQEADIALVQFETSVAAIQTTIETAARYDVPVILNPAPYQEIPKKLLQKVDYITPNETEAYLLTGIEVIDDTSAQEAAKKLVDMGIPNVMITMGKQGVYVYSADGKGRMIRSFSVEAVDTTGAGDAFSGSLACSLSVGKSLDEAVRYANATAALCVTKLGTAPAMPIKEEIDAFLVLQGHQ